MKEKLQNFTNEVKEKFNGVIDWCGEHYDAVAAMGLFIMAEAVVVYFFTATVAIVQGIIRK